MRAAILSDMFINPQKRGNAIVNDFRKYEKIKVQAVQTQTSHQFS